MAHVDELKRKLEEEYARTHSNVTRAKQIVEERKNAELSTASVHTRVHASRAEARRTIEKAKQLIGLRQNQKPR